MENTWLTFGLALCAIVLYIYKYLKDVFDYWRVRGVPYEKSNWLLGNFDDVLFGRMPLSMHQYHMYWKLAPHKYGGQFMMHSPMLMIRDPDTIKKILTKDFRHFHDRGMKFHPDVEPLTQHLFALTGEQWKNLRIKMTTAFSSGKMKAMLPLIEECASELVAVLGTVTTTSANIDHVDVKDFVSRFTIDAIGSCAFGLNIGSLRNPDSEFRNKSRKFFEFRLKSIIRSLFPNISPKLIKWFDFTFVPRDVSDFFVNLVKSAIEYRERNKVVRNDFLDILINVKNNFDLERARAKHREINELEQLVLLDDDDDSNSGKKGKPGNIDMTLDVMASQCFLFLGGGFETTATTMTFFLFELARHPDVEEQLKTEIDDVLEKYDNQLTYYALKDMKYFDMVLAETLRLYPPSPFVIRACTADYKLDDNLVVSKGTGISIPVMGLHYDEQYYENPTEFNPSNFEESAKQQRHQYTYLPFGEGPRVCIAERFAKLQIKVALVHLIKNYTFRLSPKMKLPIEFAHNLGLLAVQGGIWLQCQRRNVE